MPLVEVPRQSNFDLLAPGYAFRLWYFLKEANRQGLRVNLFESFRTPERQEWLYAQGRTRPGAIITNARTVIHSWHGYGLAGDVAFLNAQGAWFWPAVSDPRWRQLKLIAGRFGLDTGLDWKSPDAPHVQPANLKDSPSAVAKTLLAKGGPEAVWKETGHHVLKSDLLKLLAA